MTVRDSLKTAGPYAAATVLAVVCFLAGGWRNNNPDVIVPTPLISLPTSVDVPVYGGAVKVDVTTRSKTAHVRWIVYPGDEKELQVLKYSDHAQVIALQPGTYWVGADLSTADGEAVWCRIDANNGPRPPPIPPGPLPPTPDPKPIPPTPTPTPSPIAGPGFKVLVVFEQAGGKAVLTKAQYNELYGKDVASYLNSACAKDAKGQPEWRIWDKDTPLANAPEQWRQAMGRTRTSYPWVIASDGKSGVTSYEGPYPTSESLLSLLKKVGG